MRRLVFESQSERPLNLLALGAHADDIEIGAGGTVARLVREGRLACVTWVVLAARGVRAAEAEASAAAILEGVPDRDIRVLDFRDGYLPYLGPAVKETIDRLKDGPAPDLILCPRIDDRHQDHRLLGELAWNTFRDHLILEYEIPKYEGDLVPPNAFVTLTEEDARRKIDLILDCFPSQAGRQWFDEETFWSILRLRGVEAATRWAEGFHLRKVVL